MTAPNSWTGKRVLFVLCGFELGGAERQALYLARYLKGLGCDVRVWGHHHHEYPGPELVIEQCEAMGIPWAEYRFRWPCGKIPFVRDLWRLLRGLYRERPDIVLPYTTWPNMGCGLVWRWSPAGACGWGQRDLVPLSGRLLEKFAYRRASFVICNAAHEIDHLHRTLGKTPAPVFVVHNGIELPPPKQTRAEWRTEWGIPENHVVVTMLANFRTDKDHRTLLRAWRQLMGSFADSTTPPHLILAGAHQESYRDVRALVSELGLGKSVRLPGQIRDVSGFLSACDLGVLCTRAEGLPNAILEYMVSGLPVVATDIPGNREALGKNADGQLYEHGDVENLVDQMKKMIHSPDLRRSIGACNRQRAITEFSIEVMCQKMSAILNGILHGNNRAADEIDGISARTDEAVDHQCKHR